jgi:hypothetical protein
LFAVFSKVNTIARAEIDLALKNTSPNTLDVRKVPKPHAVQRRSHPPPGLWIQLAAPLAKWAASASVQIFAELNHLVLR